ncbi:S8 family serine peptidase [Paenibacillus luteus]|uniref:S8 family serine peptidase n=1 Tax=Paenibacillus luteus TaxID=2545753 RepID=UPI001141C1B2|nr:S8 family serine peptidase [Paenibacillus luteus]
MYNVTELAYCRADKWHAAGYTGRGVKVAVHEVTASTCRNLARWGGRVIDPFGVKFTDKADSHAQNVIDTLLLTAPDVEVHLMGADWLANLRYCIANGIDVYNYSATGSYNTAEFNELERKALDAGVFFVCSAGNDGARADSLSGFSRKKTWLSVGSVRWGTYNGFTGPLSNGYSSWDVRGDDLDVCGFADGLQIPSELYADKLMGVSGTSFAAPWVAGLIAVWKQRFIAEFNRKPTFEETYKAVIANAQDIEAPGYDQRTGHGVFRLPEIIAAPTYDVITATVGSVIGAHNGERVSLAAAPQLIDGRVFVGLRDVAELFGASVAWDTAKKTVTIKRERR